MRIGISGGTFDPIHTGHLIIAEKARELLSLDKVLFLPVGVPPHKDPKNTTNSEHRLEMVRLAIQDNPFFEASDIEVKRNGVTYTVDTLIKLHEMLDKDNENLVELLYIVGSDILFNIHKWKEIKKVFSLCKFVVVLRPRAEKAIVLEKIEQLKLVFAARIILIDTPLVDVSSTFVRKRLRQKRSIKYFVPERVEKYICDNKIYLDKV